MRGYEAIGMGLALVLVPMLAWMVGRMAGRRDMGVVGVIVSALIAAVVAQALAMAAGSAIEAAVGGKAAFAAVFDRRLRDLGSLPEFLGFLAAFATFVGMIGWSSVPAARLASASPVR